MRPPAAFLALAPPALALALVALAIAAPARASTEQAMIAGERQATRACLRAADLRQAVAAGRPLMFSDASMKTAILVTGRWKPAHMRGARATLLCLYDRRSRTAEIAEAPGWAAPAR